MKYYIESWTIKKLVENYDQKLIELNPPYQRNDIWSLPAKKRLIDTILKGYPLPTFFFHKTESGNYDCVDGQQRIRTILGFINEYFSTLDNKKISDLDNKTKFEDYKLPIIIIENVNEGNDESMKDFYYRVNMYGSKLNRPEIMKSKYFNNPLQNLIEKLTDSDEFNSLNLFTESGLNRMIDYDFIGELVTLLKVGITDKKNAVDRLYEDETFTENIAKEYESKFHEVLQIIFGFNKIYPIKETRYKQRNDFYTIFYFVYRNKMLSINVLHYIYKLLVLFEQDILPSNENCYAFQEYAFNCVSQSNSKNAREIRFKILKDILLNNDRYALAKSENDPVNENLIDVLNFYKLSDKDLINIEGLYLIDIVKLNHLKPDINFIN